MVPGGAALVACRCGADGLRGADLAVSRGVLIGCGICTIWPQCGHFPLRPALASDVRTCCWHDGQANSIDTLPPRSVALLHAEPWSTSLQSPLLPLGRPWRRCGHVADRRNEPRVAHVDERIVGQRR